LYESDEAYHSGKYFRSSDTEDYYANMRPTLVVTWGEPLARLEMDATPSFGDQGDSILHSLSFYGTGNTLMLTDTLPAGLDAPTAFDLEGTDVMPVYDAQRNEFTWSDEPPLGQQVTIRYRTTMTTSETVVLHTVATLQEIGGATSNATAPVIANPLSCFLPNVAR
jgi:hypothetical protein